MGTVGLSDLDRDLLAQCLDRGPGAWNEFVDRFLGLVVHVIHHSAQARSIRLNEADVEDLCAEVFMEIVRDDFRVLRTFRGKSSLATYLTVIARRVVVRTLLATNKAGARLDSQRPPVIAPDGSANHEQRIADREQVEQMLAGLNGQESQIVRMFHLEGKSYQEISTAVGVAPNSIGPMLSRAREKLRRQGN